MLLFIGDVGEHVRERHSRGSVTEPGHPGAQVGEIRDTSDLEMLALNAFLGGGSWDAAGQAADQNLCRGAIDSAALRAAPSAAAPGPADRQS